MSDAAKVLTFIVLVLLPAAQLVRDWKYHDRRTQGHHQITRGLLVTFLVCAIVSAVFYWNENRRSDQLREKVDELLEGNKQLLTQNKELTSKVDQYQVDLKTKEAQIRDLDLKARMAARGVTSTYDFNGARRQTTSGSISVDGGPEVGVFQEMGRLEQTKNLEGLLELCEAQKLKTPEWLTPYLFCGVAYANTGARDKAIENLRHVAENAPGDPNYKMADDFLGRLGGAR